MSPPPPDLDSARALLDAAPRLGWAALPSPVTELADLARAIGAKSLWVKRDDQLEPLYGSTKVRKLDYVLATPPLDVATTLHAVGAVGSGNLVALTAAAALQEKRLHAHVFWTPFSESATENLRFIASGAAEITYYGSRTTLALRRPSLLLSSKSRGEVVVPTGATSPRGMLGLVRGGMELAAQVRAGDLPEPDCVYVAFGSGGTAVGLSMGLALGGLTCRVIAVSAVERALSLDVWASALSRGVARELATLGIDPVPEPRPMRLDHAHLGRAYAVATNASKQACVRLAEAGLSIEPAYTGKAMAALFADAKRGPLGHVLFWNTCRRGPLPFDEDWKDKLPPALSARLARGGKPLVTRRTLLAFGAALVGGSVALRLTGYADLPDWNGTVLSAREAILLRAAADVLLTEDLGDGVLSEVPIRIDRYLVGMSTNTIRDVHGLLALIEHGTTLLGGGWSRFTELDREAREAFLASLQDRGGLLSQAYRGLRDLVMLGCYQQPATWESIGYEGPRVGLSYDPSGPARMAWPHYDALVAPEGALPKAHLP